MAVKTSWSAGEVLTAADLTDTFAAKANLASPTFTGTPAAPTAANGTNTTQIATTAFVQNGLSLGVGLVPVTPTSVANSGGSATVSGQAVTFSTVTSVSANGVFTASFAWYLVLILFDASAGANFSARLRASGTDATGANYSLGGSFGGPSLGNVSSTGATSWAPNLTGGASTQKWAMKLFQPQIADETDLILEYSDNRPLQGLVGGQHNVASAYDGLTLITSGGNMSGTMRFYGFRN